MKSWINVLTAAVLLAVAGLLAAALLERRAERANRARAATEAAPALDAPDAVAPAEPAPAADADAPEGRPAAVTNAAAAAPIQALRLPLEFHEDGSVKSQLRAGLADVPATGAIHAAEVRFEVFEPDGSTNLVVTAEDCTFDRVHGLATSETRVSLARADVSIRGVGLEWELTNQMIRLKHDVEVVLRRNLRARGLLPEMQPRGE
jgi:hypothetical protein